MKIKENLTYIDILLSFLKDAIEVLTLFVLRGNIFFIEIENSLLSREEPATKDAAKI